MTDLDEVGVDEVGAPGAARPQVHPGRPTWRRLAGRLYGRIRVFAGALTALVVLSAYLTATQPFFLTRANIYNVLAGNSDLMLISVGLTFVVLSAGFDLSVGAVTAAVGLAVYELLTAGVPAGISVVLGLMVGAAIGSVNGVLIGKFKLNFFVVTLGMMSLVAGLVQVITNGETKTIGNTGFFYGIGNNDWLGVPIPIWISLVTIIVAALVLNHTPFGRAVYAVGGNAEAARLAGIKVTLVLILVYAIGGLGAGLAGVVDASRLSSVAPSSGSELTLTAAAAVLLGGTSFFGGIGGVAGTVVGVLLISILQNGLGLMGVSAFWQGVVTGAVLIAAVALDRLQTRGDT
ncbi:MAG TPA: ABC transporter permease [Gaiellaceae bacterium]